MLAALHCFWLCKTPIETGGKQFIPHTVEEKFPKATAISSGHMSHTVVNQAASWLPSSFHTKVRPSISTETFQQLWQSLLTLTQLLETCQTKFNRLFWDSKIMKWSFQLITYLYLTALCSNTFEILVPTISYCSLIHIKNDWCFCRYVGVTTRSVENKYCCNLGHLKGMTITSYVLWFEFSIERFKISFQHLNQGIFHTNLWRTDTQQEIQFWV